MKRAAEFLVRKKRIVIPVILVIAAIAVICGLLFAKPRENTGTDADLSEDSQAEQTDGKTSGTTTGSFSPEDFLTRVFFCDYYENGENVKIKPGDFLRFIAEDLLNNEVYSRFISEDIKDRISALLVFADQESLETKRTLPELSQLFGISEDTLKKAMVLYYTDHEGAETGTMTLREFAEFTAGEAAEDPDLSAMFDEDTKELLQQLLKLTDKDTITQELSYPEAASLLGTDENTMYLLYIYYYSKQESYDPGSVTLKELTSALTEAASDGTVGSFIGSDMQAEISLLSIFTDAKAIQTPMTYEAIADTLGIDASLVQAAFKISSALDVSKKKMTVPVFMDYVVNDVLSDPVYAAAVDEETKTQITQVNTLIQGAAGNTELSASEIAAALGIDESTVQDVMSMMGDGDSVQSSTLTAFIGFVADHIMANPLLSLMFDEETKENVAVLDQLLTAAEDKTEMTPAELSAAAGMDEDLIDLVFVLYFTDVSDKTMSLESFTDTVLTLSADPQYSDLLDASSVSQLTMLKNIMEGTLSGNRYTVSELASLLDSDASGIKLLLTWYSAPQRSDEWALSLKDIAGFLNDHQEELSGMISTGQLSQIGMLGNVIDGTVREEEYGYSDLANMFGIKEEMMKQLFLLYTAEHGDTSGWKISAAEFLSFVRTEILADDTWSSALSDENKKLAETAGAISDAVISGKEYTPSELADLLDGVSDKIDSKTIELLALYYAGGNISDPDIRLPLYMLVKFMLPGTSGAGVSDENTEYAAAS